MALPVTDQLITQMMTENVRTSPTTPMEGNVSRPMIVSDLLSAMRDVNFNQLIEEYGSMAGIRDTKATPMTNSLMAEKERVPSTPLQTQTSALKTKAPAVVVDEIAKPIAVPTPMSNAMAQNNMSPIGSVQEQGIMSNTT